jgi:hypothetical protein
LHRIVPTALCCGLALSAAEASAQAGMSEAEATQLFGAAGFPVSGGRPLDRCGRPANPRVTFVDLNGDKRPEALFIDQGSCYAPTGRYFAVLTKEGGAWRVLINGTGTIQAQATRTAGWLDMRVAEPGCTKDHRFQGNRYAPASDCKGTAAEAAVPLQAAPQPSAPVPAATPPAAAGASPTKLSSADEAAAFKAAGFTRRGSKWRTDCDDASSPSYGPGAIDKVADLNGDGRPEVLITEGGTFCYGNTGQGYFVVTKLANGGWKLVTNGTGMAEFLNTKGAEGWPDLQVGGPGFCFPVLRWNGREYKLQRWQYDGKACRPPR